MDSRKLEILLKAVEAEVFPKPAKWWIIRNQGLLI